MAKQKHQCPACKGRCQVPDSTARDPSMITCPMCSGDGDCFAEVDACGWGEIAICRTISNKANDVITLDIRTPTRGLRITLSLADFALAVTGRGGIKAWCEENAKKLR